MLNSGSICQLEVKKSERGREFLYSSNNVRVVGYYLGDIGWKRFEENVRENEIFW